MALSNMKNSAGIVRKGSGNAWIRSCNSDGTSPGSWYSLGIVKDSTFKDSSASTFEEDEGGNRYLTTGTREVMLALTFLQRDTNLKGLWANMRGTYCSILKEQSSTTVNGVYEYLVIGIAQLEDTREVKLPGTEIAASFIANINTSALTVALTSISGAAVAGASLGSQTIPVNSYYLEFTI